MSKTVNTLEDEKFTAHKWFNMKRLIDATGINQDKIYNNFKGEYNSLTSADKKLMARTLIPHVKQLFEFLGYSVEIKKVD